MRHLKQEDEGNASPLTRGQLEVLRVILENQKRNLVFKDPFLCDLGLLIENGSDEIDQANIDVVNGQNLRFRRRENFYEKKIDEALCRIKKNEYGLCKDCYRPIKFTRLKARPTADMCIICKEESERDEVKNFSSHVRKSCGKIINFASDY